jgi:hypothetical protein
MEDLPILNSMFDDIGVKFTCQINGAGNSMFFSDCAHFIIMNESKIMRINWIRSCDEKASGSEILTRLISFSKIIKLGEIRLSDASKFDSGNCKKLNLAAWELLTKRESWYNHFHFGSTNTESEQQMLKQLLSENFDSVIEDTTKLDGIISTED